MFNVFSAKRNENDTAMFIITSPVDNSKWRLSYKLCRHKRACLLEIETGIYKLFPTSIFWIVT